MSSPVPPNEPARLAALHDLSILDTPSEQIYDDVVQLAAAICQTPVAVINFIDRDRQWGKAIVGMDDTEAPRDVSFCARTIVQDDGTLVIPDTLADADWATNPMVLDDGLRFYAGASIVDDGGHALGTVCVADHAPRDLDDQALEALRVLARQTAAHLELRRASRALAEANGELSRLALEDALTGLPNRALLMDRLAHGLRQCRRTGQLLGVVFGDLDGFKLINDRMGHQAGDRVLCAVGDRLASSARSGDTVGRLAGDEFVVVCPGIAEASDLDVVAERLRLAVAEPVDLGEGVVVPELSIGTAVALGSDDAHSLLCRADAAMYESKRERAAAGVGFGPRR